MGSVEYSTREGEQEIRTGSASNLGVPRVGTMVICINIVWIKIEMWDHGFKDDGSWRETMIQPELNIDLCNSHSWSFNVSLLFLT